MLETRTRRCNIVAVGTLLILLTTLAVVIDEASASERSDAARAALKSSFRTLPIEDGWLLQPTDGDLGLRTIEVRADRLVIDGQRISRDELEARLGDLAPAILELQAATGRAGADSGAAESEIEIERIEEVREPAPPSPPPSPRPRGNRDRSDSQVVVGSDLTVEEDDVYRDIVIFGGHLTIDGQVIGDAVSIGGGAEVSGEITGDLAVIGGSIELRDGARIMGDVVSVGGSVERADGAEVAGQVVEVPFGPSLSFAGNWGNWGHWKAWGDWDEDVDIADQARDWGRHARWFGFFEAGWELIGLLFVGLLACLAFLIARKPVERIATKVSDEPWKSGLVGLLTQILCVPVLVLVCVVLLVSIIGIPLLLLVPFAILGFVLIAFLGFTSVAYRLGNYAEERFGWNFQSPYVSLLLGVGLLEVLSLVGEFLGLGPGPIKFFAAMFAIFGALVSYLAWTIGLGAAVLTRFGTWGGQGGPAYSSLPVTPVSPVATEPMPPVPDWDPPSASPEGEDDDR